MRHSYTRPRNIHNDPNGSRALSFCKGCGLLRLELRSRRAPNRPQVLFLVVPTGERDPIPVLYEPFCSRTPLLILDNAGDRVVTAPDRARAASFDLGAAMGRDAVTLEKWRELSGMTGLVHIRNHERKIERLAYVRPRMLVHTLCGIHETQPQGTFLFVELVIAMNPRMFGPGDAVCTACALLVRKRGGGLTIDRSKIIEHERN